MIDRRNSLIKIQKVNLISRKEKRRGEETANTHLRKESKKGRGSRKYTVHAHLHEVCCCLVGICFKNFVAKLTHCVHPHNNDFGRQLLNASMPVVKVISILSSR